MPTGHCNRPAAGLGTFVWMTFPLLLCIGCRPSGSPQVWNYCFQLISATKTEVVQNWIDVIHQFCTSHEGCAPLNTYLDQYYFSTERQKLWSKAYRPNWLCIHTNNHVESWHKKIKYYFFPAGVGGSVCYRVDDLINILNTAATGIHMDAERKALGFTPSCNRKHIGTFCPASFQPNLQDGACTTQPCIPSFVQPSTNSGSILRADIAKSLRHMEHLAPRLKGVQASDLRGIANSLKGTAHLMNSIIVGTEQACSGAALPPSCLEADPSSHKRPSTQKEQTSFRNGGGIKGFKRKRTKP